MNLEIANPLEERLLKAYGKLDIEYLNFSPVYVAVQYILKDEEAYHIMLDYFINKLNAKKF